MQNDNKEVVGFVLCLDISGSMDESAIDNKKNCEIIERIKVQTLGVKALLTIFSKLLRNQKRVNASVVAQLDRAGYVVTICKDVFIENDVNLNDVFNKIDRFGANGSTDIYKAVETTIAVGAEICEKYNTRSAFAILMTDGQDSHIDYSPLAKKIKYLPISLSVIGISALCDFDLLSKIARTFDGIAMYAHDHKSIIDSIKYLSLMIIHAIKNFTHVLGDRSGQTEMMSHKICQDIDVYVHAKDGCNENFEQLKKGGANDDLKREFKYSSVGVYSKDYDEIEKALKKASDAKLWGWKYIMSLWFSYRYNVPVNSRDKSGQSITSSEDAKLLKAFETACSDLPVLQTRLLLNWSPVVNRDDFESEEEYDLYMKELNSRRKTLQEEWSKNPDYGLSIENSCTGGCFDINALVCVRKDGHPKFVAAKNLSAGDFIYSTNGLIGEVETIFVTEDSVLERTTLMNTDYESLEITSRHPVRNSYDSNWIYPKDSPDALIDMNTAVKPMTVCTIMLTSESTSRGCVSVMIKGGFEVIAAGHGIVGDAIAEHCFFGNRTAMLEYKNYIISKFPERYDNTTGVVKINANNKIITSY